MVSQAGLSWEIKLAQRSRSLRFSMIQCPLIIYEVVRHPRQVTDRMLCEYRDTVRWPLSCFALSVPLYSPSCSEPLFLTGLVVLSIPEACKSARGPS